MSLKDLAEVIGLSILLGAFAVADAAQQVRQTSETIAADQAVRLSTGSGNHVCHARADGTAWCWGRNDQGQLGNGTLIDSGVPVQVLGLTRVIAVTTGGDHSCALTSFGRVYCWGSNDRGKVGNGSATTYFVSPVEITGFSDTPVALGAGTAHTCALLVNATVSCWGKNVAHQVSSGSTADRLSPVTYSGLSNVIALAVDGDFNCAVIAGGTARCWGRNSVGQLGAGNNTAVAGLQDVVGLSNVVAIAAGAEHACALLADSTARCWGRNVRGQLGNGNTTDQFAPVVVNGLLGGFVQISAGTGHTCGVRTDGTATCWGLDSSGELGNGNNNGSPTVSGLLNTLAISSGSGRTCALQADGVVQCWGSNLYGALGNGGVADQTIPAPVVDMVGSVVAVGVAAGGVHSCAVRANGTASCWGNNVAGQLGSGSTSTTSPPTSVDALTNARGVAAGTNHTCALTAAGRVQCWGANYLGQLGGGTNGYEDSPVAFGGLYQVQVSGLSLGADFACTLVAGSVGCWGDNDYGQLGDQTIVTRPTPNAVAGLSNVVSIATGFWHACAVKSDGTVRCWGNNAYGSLGNGETGVIRTSPVGVLGINTALSVVAGEGHTCALLSEGTVRCWGANGNGQLGDGTKSLRSSPVLVSGLSQVIALAAGSRYTCALQAGGQVRCWGANANGQLGDNTATDRSTPVPTLRINTVATARTPETTVALTGRSTIAAKSLHSCSTEGNGTVRCWGHNGGEKVGIDTGGTFVKTATTVPSFTVNIKPKASVSTSGRVTIVNIVGVCEPWQQIHVSVELTQGDISASGVGQGQCTGGLATYPVTVPVHGRYGLNDGPAIVNAVATIRDRGKVVDEQQWTRVVTVTTAL